MGHMVDELHNSHMNTIPTEPKPPDLLRIADTLIWNRVVLNVLLSLRRVRQASEAGDFLFWYLRNCQIFPPT